MDKEAIKEVFAEANELADGVPQHLQVKAFEIAVGILVGGVPQPPKYVEKREPAHTPLHEHEGGEQPAVSDLLKVCKQNPDKYVVFLHDLESRGETATLDVLAQLFKDYRQDPPADMLRDLKNLSAKDWAKQSSRGAGAPWELRSKGRQRYQELVAKVHAE
jgi:hypothetical protein